MFMQYVQYLFANGKKINCSIKLSIIKKELSTSLQHLRISVRGETFWDDLQRSKLLRLKRQIQCFGETTSLQNIS